MMIRRVLLAALLLCGCASQPSVVLDDGVTRVQMQVEVANTPLTREHGLMGRTALPDDAGMLFVFDREQSLNFWMKNTLIPLDILYFAADGHFVSSATMQPCAADPCPTYASKNNAQYALELAGGWLTRHPLGQGTTLELHDVPEPAGALQ